MKNAKAARNVEKVEQVLHGQGLLARVAARKTEIECTLALVQAEAAHEDTHQRLDTLEEALNAIEQLLPPDVDNLSDATAALVNTWLEATRFLPAEKVSRARRTAAPQRPPVAEEGSNAVEELNISHGATLLERTNERRRELERTLATVTDELPEGHLRRSALEDSLRSLEGLLEGADANLSTGTSAQLAGWLENTRYLVDTAA